MMGMDHNMLQVGLLVSLVLAASAVGLFAWLLRHGTFDHADRLALLPIDDDRDRLHPNPPHRDLSEDVEPH